MPRFASRAGIELAYRETGRGPRVVLLHPFPLDGRAWDGQIRALAAEHRLLAVDFPGFGESAPPPRDLKLSTVAAAIAELLRDDRAPAAIVGLSMGGYVLLELLAQAPELVTAAVLADTRAGPDSAEGAEGRRRFALRAETEGVAWVAPEMLPRLLRPDADPLAARTVIDRIAAATPAGVAAAQRAMASRADWRPLLPGLRLPVLVIAGARDLLIPPEESFRMAAAIPGARLTVIPGAGHLANLDEPEAFNRALVSFLTA